MWAGAAEGGIDITITLSEGRVASVAVDNRRLVNATAPLLRCSGGQAAERVARLFAICRVAQGVCSAAALERAAGIDAGPAQGLARRFLLLGETVLEHGCRAAFDWPALMGEPPRLGIVKTLRAALVDLHRVLYPDGDWMRPGGGRLAPDPAAIGQRLERARQTVEDGVFNGAAPLDAASWEAWQVAGKTPAARLTSWLRAASLADFGVSAVPALPDIPAEALDASLRADGDGSFTARPDWQGDPRHSGPLARQAAHPLVAGAIADHGPGVLAHFTARLVELSLCLREMRAISAMLGEDAGKAVEGGEGHGLGVVEAARGRLAHRVELKEGKVTRYQILAPTEWNFHPDGALARGLAGQPVGSHPLARARLLVCALDPCVAYSVRVA